MAGVALEGAVLLSKAKSKAASSGMQGLLGAFKGPASGCVGDLVGLSMSSRPIIGSGCGLTGNTSCCVAWC